MRKKMDLERFQIEVSLVELRSAAQTAHFWSCFM
jgi:hypothetical protein